MPGRYACWLSFSCIFSVRNSIPYCVTPIINIGSKEKQICTYPLTRILLYSLQQTNQQNRFGKLLLWEGCVLDLVKFLALLYNTWHMKLTLSFSQLQNKLVLNNPITVYSVLLSTGKMQSRSWPLLYLLIWMHFQFSMTTPQIKKTNKPCDLVVSQPWFCRCNLMPLDLSWQHSEINMIYIIKIYDDYFSNYSLFLKVF